MVNAAWEQMVGISRQDVIGNARSSRHPRRATADHQQETDVEVLATKQRGALRNHRAWHATGPTTT